MQNADVDVEVEEVVAAVVAVVGWSSAGLQRRGGQRAIPQKDILVDARGDEVLAVGQPGARGDGVGVLAEGANTLAGSHLSEVRGEG